MRARKKDITISKMMGLVSMAEFDYNFSKN